MRLVLTQASGYTGPMANLLKTFATPIQVATTLVLYVQLAVAGGVAATPGVFAALKLHAALTAGRVHPFVNVMVACICALLAYFMYALAVIFVIPLSSPRSEACATAQAGSQQSSNHARVSWR